MAIRRMILTTASAIALFAGIAAPAFAQGGAEPDTAQHSNAPMNKGYSRPNKHKMKKPTTDTAMPMKSDAAPMKGGMTPMAKPMTAAASAKGGPKAQDAAVDMLNQQSLQAAQQGMAPKIK